MATDLTPEGYVYPLGDDPIRNGDNVIAQLAAQLPPRLIMQGPGPGMTVTPGGGGRFTINFNPVFKSRPAFGIMLLAPQTTDPITLALDSTNGPSGGISADRATVLATGASGNVVTYSIAVQWWAIGVVDPTPPA